MYTSRLLSLVVGSLILLALLAPMVRPMTAAQEPVLSIPGDISAQSGDVVQAPVRFTGGGQAIAGVAFSLDFEESCLALNTADGDGNGVPDGVHLLTPGAFRASVSFDASDTDGELDVTIADYAPPFAALPDQTLLTLEFTVICTPAPTTTRQAPVAFALLPQPSFSDPNGRDIAGSSQDGAVTVLGAQVDTPTPTPTPTPTATPAATATSTATATTETPVATAMPTVTLTPTVTGTMEPTTTPATPTPTLIATGTPQPTGTPPRLYMPLVVR